MQDEFKTRCYFEMALIEIFSGQVPKKYEIIGTFPDQLVLAVYDKERIKPFPNVKAEVCITNEEGEKLCHRLLPSRNPEDNEFIFKIKCLDSKKEIHEQLDKHNKEEKNDNSQNESD